MLLLLLFLLISTLLEIDEGCSASAASGIPKDHEKNTKSHLLHRLERG